MGKGKVYEPEFEQMGALRGRDEVLDVDDERRVGYEVGCVRRVLAAVVTAYERRLLLA
jgi:hypothetical protein